MSLLLLNAIANEAMPLFLDKLVPPWAAILISVTAVLFVGEIIPAAVFTGPAKMRSVYALFPPPAAGQIRCSLLTQLLRRSRIAALLSPLAWFIVMLSSPISYPLGWALRRPLPTRTARNLPRHFPEPSAQALDRLLPHAEGLPTRHEVKALVDVQREMAAEHSASAGEARQRCREEPREQRSTRGAQRVRRRRATGSEQGVEAD